MASTHASGRESTNCRGERIRQHSRVARKPANRPAPSGRRRSRAFFLRRRGAVTSPGWVLARPSHRPRLFPPPVGRLVLLNVHLHRISYSKCLPVCRLKALTQGLSSSPGARSELKIRVRVLGSRSRQYHGQLHFQKLRGGAQVQR